LPTRIKTYTDQNIRRLAVIGGAYGNLPPLKACIEHAHSTACDMLEFLGNATGPCGYSDATVTLIRQHCSIIIAGNHEQQAAADSSECGCSYASEADERYGCLAHP